MREELYAAKGYERQAQTDLEEKRNRLKIFKEQIIGDLDKLQADKAAKDRKLAMLEQ